MTAWLAFPAALFVGSLLFVAAITARESLRPRPTVAAVDPCLMCEVDDRNRELDQQIADGLRDWGKGDVA